jgi:DNA helicase-2/ATP-dependent DNA helicase PcrA
VKDVLAFLRVVDNPRDEVSWYRVLLLMPGIGEATARGLVGAMAEQDWRPDAFERLTPPGRAKEAHRALAALIRTLRGRDVADPGADISTIRDLYDDILRERYDRPEPRLADLDQLRTIAAGYPSRAAFLSALALDPPQNTQDLADSADPDEGDALVLSTAHSAKGKEWDAVFVIWAVDGWFPSSRALGSDEDLEEERRLMYVAMTRARDHLHVVYPVNVYATRRSADYTMDQLSRFIDAGVQRTMQRVAMAADESDGESAAEPTPSPVVDLRALLRNRFGGG